MDSGKTSVAATRGEDMGLRAMGEFFETAQDIIANASVDMLVSSMVENRTVASLPRLERPRRLEILQLEENSASTI